ncbi:Holliday junction resolvase RecU [Abyssisolibacter fermentans]|uniref:Holliday junction resolvase RecU n=1 Tax=Abyssisolibacter fermentans TaxID=1766203 RepID=UPI00082E8839|nr:Holliday junction resolvase RecU [Abyssisolibacter fermentans]
MTKWRTYGHRGDETEELINSTNEYYRNYNVGIITKIPVPIKVMEINRKNKEDIFGGKTKGSAIITKAFFEEKSTVDYIGCVQGFTIVFDAKETNKNYLPLQNIHKHQIEYMELIRKQRGIAFIIAHFKIQRKFYLIPIEIIKSYYDRSFKGGRKSIPMEDLDNNFEIAYKNGLLYYLDTVNTYLDYIKEGKIKSV